VLAWVEKTVKKLAKGEQRQFKGLLGILRAAADKKLAYWEATDLAVPPAGQFPGDPRLMLANYLGNEPGSASDKVEAAPIPGHFDRYGCAVLDNWLVGTYDPSHYEQTGPPETNFWDMSVWPPPLKYSLSEFVAYQAHAGDGRWLLISETDPKAAPRNFRPRLFTDLGKKCAGQFPVIIDGTEQYVNTRFGGFVEDRLLVLAHVPMWLEGKHWTPAPGFPNAASDIPAVKGIVDLNDGSDVVIWDGDGYELRGKRFVKTFSMAATGLRRHWTYAPAGADGFFYLSNRLLFEVHRGNQPTPHATRWTNIMYIRPGPAGSILLQEGDNKDGDVAKLYFPGDDTFIHIEPELFDDKEYAFIAWSEKADRFVVAAEKFLAVRTATVLALPRYRVSTGKKVKS